MADEDKEKPESTIRFIGGEPPKRPPKKPARPQVKVEMEGSFGDVRDTARDKPPKGFKQVR